MRFPSISTAEPSGKSCVSPGAKSPTEAGFQFDAWVLSHCNPSAPPLAMFLGFPIFIVAIVGLMFFVKCPRCSGRLGQLAATTLVRGFLSRPINFCPYCGVNIDEPYAKP